MSSIPHPAPGGSWLSRRRVLALAATGVGASVVSVSALSFAGEDGGEDGGAPLVISLRDAKAGTIDIFFGEQVKTITDPSLAAALLKAAGR